MDWGKKWLVDFNAGKSQLVLFDQSNNTGTNTGQHQIGGSVLEANHPLGQAKLIFCLV